jgi:hypothetical protein
MKNGLPGLRITSAHDSGRPVIPLENGVWALNADGSTGLAQAIRTGESVTFAGSKPATSALRLGAPDPQKQSSNVTRPQPFRGGPHLRIATTFVKINTQQPGR